MLIHISFRRNGQQIKNRYNAAAIERDNIELHVLKSSMDAEFDIVISTKLANANLQTFNFSEKGYTPASYKLEVVKNGKTVRCSSRVFNSQLKLNYLLYPLPANDRTNLDASRNNQMLVSPYQIVTLTGVVLKSSQLKELKNHLDIKDLPRGIFFVHIVDDIIKLAKQ